MGLAAAGSYLIPALDLQRWWLLCHLALFNLADSLRLSLGVSSATVLLMVVSRLAESWMGRPHPDVFFSSAALYLFLPLPWEACAG